MFQKYLFHCTEKCISALNIGIKEMVNMHRKILIPEFILLGLIEQHDSAVIKILAEMEIDVEEVRDNLVAEIYTLQGAENVTGPYVDLTRGASKNGRDYTAPFSAAGPARFLRLRLDCE